MTQIEALEQLVKTQKEQNKALQQTIKELSSQVAWLNRQLFGRKSEKLAHLDPNQLNLFEENSLSQQDEELEEKKEAAKQEIAKMAREKKKERSNRKLLKDLPVIEVIIEPEDVDLTLYKRMGEERTRTLEFEPGKLYVKEIVRPKYGLKDNTLLPEGKNSSVLIAPLPLLPIYKGLPGASLLTEILLQKYTYHLPFYRQLQAFRHLGLKIPESTLNGWFKPVCELLYPLYEKLKQQVLATDYIQVDETVLPVINKENHRACKEYLWVVRSVMKKLVFFHYDKGSRSGQTAKDLLSSFTGYLQSDGYSAYNQFEEKFGVHLVGCMAHIRRYFENALEENKSLAEHALTEIQQLYIIERKADEKELSPEETAALRQKLATPILDALEKWMEQTYPKVLPKSRLGKAIAYAYSIWPRMKAYLKDGRLRIDNNLAENAVRPIALSRKNFLFCGNHEAAKNTAVICSLLASCKAADVNPRVWLKDILSKLPYYLKPGVKKEIAELLPNQWKERNSNDALMNI